GPSLRAPPAAGRTRQPSRQEHGDWAQQCGHDPDGCEGFAEQGSYEGEESDRERGVIHVAPCEVTRARHVIELVAEPAVLREAGQVEEERGERESSRKRVAAGVCPLGDGGRAVQVDPERVMTKRSPRPWPR